jgi:solute:Na+ symporter, SSS family
VHAATEQGKFRLLNFDFAWDRTGTIVLVAFSANYYLQKYITDQTIVQRMLLAPSHTQAACAIWRSSLLVLAVWILFMTLGVSLWAFYSVQPELLPAGVRSAPDRVFPHFIGHSLPDGVSGLLLAALIAGTLSTLSADLNSLGSVLLEDYYKRWVKPNSERRLLWFSRLVTIIAGVGCVALAMAFTRVRSMADAALEFVSLVGGGVLGMFLLGIFTKRATSRGLYVGIGCSIAFVLWAHFCGPGKTALAWMPRFPLHTLWVGLMGNVIVFLVGYAASRVFSGSRQAVPPEFNYEPTESKSS